MFIRGIRGNYNSKVVAVETPCILHFVGRCRVPYCTIGKCDDDDEGGDVYRSAGYYCRIFI